ncbi:S2-RNase [Pyrus ussuriensis x Pyrus communis]|uniref:S2-RNase n=1 Tax=Pyrus ussuriensis x Pyrus communis TaxID=2448454 RepID=A0A5N5FZ19_9ROSA|nr:S2-RNase [Pyrus ussuriensis x Pyrus communis]
MFRNSQVYSNARNDDLMKKETTTYIRASETFSPPFLLVNVLKVDEVTLNPNGVFVRVLVEVDLRVHLKRVLIINDDDDDCPFLVSYEKLFEVCFYCEHRRPDGHICLEYEVDDRCFLIERMFEEEPAIFLEDTNVDADIREALHDDVMLCFPVALLPEENFTETKEVGHIMVRHYGFGQVEGGKSYKDVASKPPRDAGKEVGKVEKYKWVPRADLVQDWRKSPSSGVSNRVVSNKGEMDVNMVFASMAAEVSRPSLRLKTSFDKVPRNVYVKYFDQLYGCGPDGRSGGSKLLLEPLNFLFENGIRKFGDIKIKQQILFYRLSEKQKRAMKGDILILNFEKCLREELSSVLRTEEGPAILESPTSSEKSGGKVTNEDLQATMVQVLKSMEKITLETRGEIRRLYSLTGSQQRKLDLEYSTPNNGYAREIIREESPEKEPVIPLFLVHEEKRDKGKNKKDLEIVSQY